MSPTLRPLAALAVAALIGAACSNAPPRASIASNGGPSPSSTASPSAASNTDKAVQFSQCMRRNGVSAFPDPPASGELTIDGVANGSSLNPNSPAFTTAISACKDLEPAGFTGHKRSALEQENALKFAQCIRANGMPDFQDPPPDGPLINVDGSKPGVIAALNAAEPKCRNFATAAGVRAP